VSFLYQTGEDIRKGDFVLFHGEPGRIELAVEILGNPETDWFIREYGGGVMILEGIAGRTFIAADHLPDNDDLEFVSRSDKRHLQ